MSQKFVIGFSNTFWFLLVLLVFFTARKTLAQRVSDPRSVLTEQEWQRVDLSISRGLTWLASRQARDGSFPTKASGQPGISSLAGMAFLANGHTMDRGRYQKVLQQAVKYTSSCQQENGIIAVVSSRGPTLHRNVDHNTGRTAVYNHAISALFLSEAYGQNPSLEDERLRNIIQKALDATLTMQRWRKEIPEEQGGWRYLDKFEKVDSDLSIAGWQLMFLRSAKNAGFEVEDDAIEEAVGYVRRCIMPRQRTFTYMYSSPQHITRGMAGAGVLALGHAGFHNSKEAEMAADWLLEHPFDRYNRGSPRMAGQGHIDRYHYGLFMCCQGMYQMGGKHWKQFFPVAVKSALDGQRLDGSWDLEYGGPDRQFGNAYTSALCILSLSAPNQLLPIFQR